jgi:cell division septum initiation protein DivIVA
MDKLLDNINAKMDNFTMDTQNQLSFNKILETQIQQISTTIPSLQDSVRSILTMFKEKALKFTEGSLGGVDRDKKPNAAENFSMKSS